jgi:hypothetical protein
MITSSKPIVDHHRCHCGAAGAFGYWRSSAAHDSVWFCAEHRQGVWFADECTSKAEAVHALAQLFGFEGAHPSDLQELVAEHGGYDRITPKAWAEHDTRIAAWQARRRGRMPW